MDKKQVKKKIRRYTKQANEKVQPVINRAEKIMYDAFKKVFPQLAKKLEGEEELTKEELKQKIKMCDKLGASKFQPIVLKAEAIKFKVLKDLFPGIQTKYEKYCKKKRDEALELAETEEERRQIIDDYRNQILEWRKELKREKNRNYHMDENKPTEMIQYLKWNKQVHEKGLVKNGIVILGATIALALGISPALAATLIALELGGALVNFQCVNIQNSHIYRYKILEPALKKKEEKRNQNNVANYSQAAKVYARSIEGKVDVPTIEEMIANVRTPEEAAELLKMIHSVQAANAKRKGQNQQTDQQQKVVEKQESIPAVIESPSIEQQVLGKETFSSQNVTQDVRKNVDIEIERMMNEQLQAEVVGVKSAGVQKTIGGKK